MNSIPAIVRPVSDISSAGSSGRLRALAVVGLAVAALTLAGCGRKTGLDAPPNAAAYQDDVPQQPVQSSADRSAGSLLDPPGTGRAPVAARGDNRRILLDGLID